jgi:hypothetical protein
MTLREANYDSHSMVSPLSQSARGNLSTTVQYPTQKNRTLDFFLSFAVPARGTCSEAST